MPVRDLMRTNVITAEPDISVEKLSEIMRIEEVGSVVVTEENRVLGMVTDRDVTVRTVGVGRTASGLTARDIMTVGPYSVDVDLGILELTKLMGDLGVRRIPVTEGGKLAGIVTLDDVLRLLAEELENLAIVASAEGPSV